ncbi:MAG: hypothetical protein ACI8X5_001869 [Planctomycetota bacterium]|jgi:hypothetical protein
MSLYVPKTSLRNVAVLALSSSMAEWLEYDSDGSPLYASVPVKGEGVRALAQAAIDAREAAGGTTWRCRLALGEGLIAHRILALPSLGKRELRQVLERKSAQAITAEGKTALYSGIDVGPSQGHLRNWLTLTVEKELVTELMIRLRSNRFRVKKLAATILAGMHRANEPDGKGKDVSIAVTIEDHAVEVSLISGDQLVSSDTLKGSLQSNPHLGTGLLQLVRTSAAFWRKTQRGAEVTSVQVIGMPADRGHLLATALESALPGTLVVCYPHSDDETLYASRIAVLSACLGDGPLAHCISVSLPPRRSFGMVGLAVCAGSLLLGFGIVERLLQEPRAELLTQIARLEGQTADLPRMERQEQTANEALGLIKSRMSRALEFGKEAPDYQASMANVLEVLVDRASLLSITVLPALKSGNELQFTALTNTSSVAALTSVREVQEALEASSGFSDVRVDLPASLVDGDGHSGFSFTVQAHLESPQ